MSIAPVALALVLASSLGWSCLDGMAVVWGGGLFGETSTPRVGTAAALRAAGVGALRL